VPRPSAKGMAQPSVDQSTRLDSVLSIRKGRLYVEACEALELAEQFGTPLYVISETQLRQNFRRYLAAFRQRWPEGPVRVLPSIKANFSLALRAILTSEGAGCDTFGEGEWFAAMSSGVSPALISVNGSSKSRELLEQAIEAGARITLDSEMELELVREIARAKGRRASVRFRLRPRYSELRQPSDFDPAGATVRDLARRYKPGIPTEVLRRVGRKALVAPELDVTGVMVHLGRHSTDLEVWRGMVRSVVDVLSDLKQAWGGWEPGEIDLGGGFASPRDPTGRLTPQGQSRPLDALAPTPEEYAEALTSTLRSELERRGLIAEGKALEIEPGRALYADAGLHLTSVRHVKSQQDPIPYRWVETDTSEMFLLDSLVEHNRWTPIAVGRAAAPPTHTADIVGISCGFDVVVPQARLPEVEPGDVLALLDTGAYQDACANNFNALPRPGTVLVRGAEAEWIKRPETIEDVFRRDQIPSRLKRPGGLAEGR